jgi:cobalt-zinc-cadmium efflux system outer membrane protein
VPSSVTRPGHPLPGAERRRGIEPPGGLSPMTLPLYGPLALPSGKDEGPPDGMTLDVAIERLVKENLELKAKSLELPKAQADVLTASLRANPILYADSQYVPYGSFSEERSGGPTQYDLNISYPLDLTGKRRARTVAAQRAKDVLQAQYQDAVRVQIDNLYTAFVDVLAAREALRYTDASIEGLTRLVAKTRDLQRQQERTGADVSQIEVQLESAEVERMEAEEALRDAKRTLAVLLNIPTVQAGTIEPLGTLRPVVPVLPPAEDLVRAALAERPDVVSYRLGIRRAKAEVDLAEANRLADVYLLYQPFTYQDNLSGQRDSTSWAVGVTVPLPVYNRNQGNIARARIGVTQTATQLADVELRTIAEVEQAARQFEVSKAAAERIEKRLLPSATKIRQAAEVRFTAGEADAIELLSAQRGYNDVVRQFRDTLIRHRRSSLRLNTAVGRRLLP